MRLAPFWRYYGGKFRLAPKYPAPLHDTIVEPFAGAAGYAMRYHDRKVILVDKYPVVAEMWRWLIGASRADVLAVPCVEAVADLPASVPAGARYLVGFCLNAAAASPCTVLSAGRKKMAALGRHFEGWNEAHRERVANMVGLVKHWQIIEGDYTAAPDVEATWFIDPPYRGQKGSYYKHVLLECEYPALAAWSRRRRGQVMVCEAHGADWLPFRPFYESKAFNGVSREVVWP